MPALFLEIAVGKLLHQLSPLIATSSKGHDEQRTRLLVPATLVGARKETCAPPLAPEQGT